MLIGGAASGEAESPPTKVSGATLYAQAIAQASARFGIPVTWITAVMRAESGGRARAVSPKGALGLMQIMPRTWAALRPRYGLGDDPFDPGDNIVAGAAYLRELYDRFGSPGFLSAYNAGPGRYAGDLAAGRPLPAETRLYVARVTSTISAGPAVGAAASRSRGISWRVAALFPGRDVAFVKPDAEEFPPPMARSERAHPAMSAALGAHPSGLFVVTSSQGAGL